MTETTSNPKARIAATYNSASDHYDEPALSFWAYYGERGAERAALTPGEIVLDVCSGSGASAIPAARRVGPSGRVIGLDLAESLIAKARTKASAEGLANVEFRHADFDQAYFRNASFDAVLCCFGIFFFPDMTATLRKMWRLLRPGGRLVIVTWGKDTFEPADTPFWETLRTLRPGQDWPAAMWKKLSEPADLRNLFGAAGIDPVGVETEDRDHPLRTPEDWWTIVMGSGYRWAIDQLSTEERERLHAVCVSLGKPSIRASAHLAVAVKS